MENRFNGKRPLTVRSLGNYRANVNCFKRRIPPPVARLAGDVPHPRENRTERDEDGRGETNNKVKGKFSFVLTSLVD